MIDSAISDGHHFYALFFNSTAFENTADFVNYLCSSYPRECKREVLWEDKESSVSHIQIPVANQFGSSTVLDKNKVDQWFYYDLYVGSIGKYKVICFPYRAMLRLLLNQSPKVFSNRCFYKPVVNMVLDSLRANYVKEPDLSIDLIKYSAEIEEQDNADRVNIVGTNPQNSKVFKLLNESDSIQIRPSSLKLRFWKLEEGQLDFVFDRLGNFRFWISKGNILSTLKLLPDSIRFFEKIGALEETDRPSKNTTIEDADY